MTPNPKARLGCCPEGSCVDEAVIRAPLDAEIERLRAALDRYRYAYRWWQADSYDVGGEMRARFNWAAHEDIETVAPDTNRFAEIGHQFLRATGRALEQEASKT